MDNFLRFYPGRCLECPELLNDATAGDRCAACVERARDAAADADRDIEGRRSSAHRNEVKSDPIHEVTPKRAASAG